MFKMLSANNENGSLVMGENLEALEEVKASKKNLKNKMKTSA